MRYSRGLNINLEWNKSNRNEYSEKQEKQNRNFSFRPVEEDLFVKDSINTSQFLKEKSDSALHLNAIIAKINHPFIDHPIEVDHRETQILTIENKALQTIRIQNKPTEYDPSSGPIRYRRVSNYTLAALILGIVICTLMIIAIYLEFYFLTIPFMFFPYIILAMSVIVMSEEVLPAADFGSSFLL